MARSRAISPARKRPRFRLKSCARDDPHSSRTEDGLADAASAFIKQLQRSDLRRVQDDLKDTLRSLAAERNRVASLSEENGRLRCQRDGYCRKLEGAERDAGVLERKIKEASAAAHAERARMESELQSAKEQFSKESAGLRARIGAVEKEKDDALDNLRQSLGRQIQKEMVDFVRSLGEILGKFADPESDGEAAPPEKAKDETSKQTPNPPPPPPATPVVDLPSTVSDSSGSSYYSDSEQGRD